MDTNDSQPTNQPLGRPLGMPPGTDEEQPMPKSRTITDPDEKQVTPQPTPTTPKARKPQGASKRIWLIALIALLLAGGIGGGIYYFLSQKDSRTLDDDEEDMEMVDEDTDEDDMAGFRPCLTGTGTTNGQYREGDQQKSFHSKIWIFRRVLSL